MAATITPPAALKEKVTIKAEVKWLSCKDVCIPGKADLAITLPVADVQAKSKEAPEFEKLGWAGDVKLLPEYKDEATAAVNARQTNSPSNSPSILSEKLNVQGEKSLGLPMYLLFAFVGGFILNFMPCVLPVIALKICNLVEQANRSKQHIRLQGLAFVGGMISCFMLLAAIVLAVQATGNSVGWGFLFQNPVFLIGMCVVVLLFALSLFGMFYITLPGQQGVDQLASQQGYVGTFFKGVLATVLSTPCTAPFLGTALGFALTQNAWTVVAIFFAIGLGMSLPYFLLMAKPDLIRFMPKPGAWMERFKESMGFVLLATVAWLLFVLGTTIGADGVVRTVGFLIAIAFAAWVVSSFTSLCSSPTAKTRAWAAALSVVALSFYFCYGSRPGFGLNSLPATVISRNLPGEPGAIDWQPYTVAKLDGALNSGKTVFLDFTAEWCLTCKVNERTVLDSKPVVDKMKALNIVAIKADWTTQNPQISSLLAKFNRFGVPLYVIFPAGKPTQPIVLPEVLSPELVLEKLNEAGPSKN